MMLLQQAQHRVAPFPFFTCRSALPEHILRQLLALCSAGGDWKHHTDGFYQASLLDVTDRISTDFQVSLRTRMRELMTEPLANRMQITVQRMQPGQCADPHTDRPLLGFESVRLIVQLNRTWQPDHGGRLFIHGDATGQQIHEALQPTWNSALGLALTPRSHHAIEPTTVLRRTAVFHWWHPGNLPSVAQQIHAIMDGMHFQFTPAVEATIEQAEMCHPEQDTYRAGGVAHVLRHWGLPETAQVRGYLDGLNPLDGTEPGTPITLARWIQHLWAEDFDSDLWARLSTRMQNLNTALARLCFPSSGGHSA